MSSEPRYRSLFWPTILIGIGLVWFLSNILVFPSFNPFALFKLWPLLLIYLGFDLLFGRKSVLVGLLIGLVTIGAAIAILLAAPNLNGNLPVTTDFFTEPMADATSAVIDIHSSSKPVNFHSLNDPTNLFEGKIMHTQMVDFVTSGSTQKHITLSNRSPIIQFFFGLSNFYQPWEHGFPQPYQG